MTGQDADEIIHLRDSKQLSWDSISNRIGYHRDTCKSHYKQRKEGKKYINDEFAPFVKSINPINLTSREITEICNSNGFPIKNSYVTDLLHKHHITYKYASTFSSTNQCIKEAIQLCKEEGFTPYGSLRCVYEGSETTFYHLLLKLEEQLKDGTNKT